MNLWTKWAKRMNAGYCIAFLLLILCFVLTQIISTNFTTQSNIISGTDTTLDQLDEMLTNLKSAQVSWGEYALTKNYKSLNQYYATRKKIDSLFGEIYQFSPVSSQQKNSLDTLGSLLGSLFSESNNNPVLLYRKNAGRLLDSLKHKSAHNALFVDSITSIIRSMQQEAQNKAGAQKQSLDTLSDLLKILGYSMMTIALFLAIHMLIIYNRERTAKRIARGEAKQYHQQLEARIDELTEVNKEIVRLKSMEKFTALGRVAMIIAHDIKNPLTNINLATTQIRDELQQEDLNLYLDIIKRNSDKINEHINHFLNVTAFTALNTRNVSVNKLLDEILAEAADRINLEKISVVRKYTEDICDIVVDAGKIKTAFLNLVFNAIDAMETGKGVLTVQTLSKADTCIVVIADNGVGMDEETMAKVFEPYYTTKTHKGSGLGLAQTQNIILNHDGNIEVESKLGEGTRFIVTLNFA